MAAEGDVELELEAEPNGSAVGGDGAGGRPAEKPRKHDSGAADLERVTDYAEEKEIQSSNLETVRGGGEEERVPAPSGFPAASQKWPPRGRSSLGSRPYNSFSLNGPETLAYAPFLFLGLHSCGLEDYFSPKLISSSVHIPTR